jgi:hypothetical protein
MHAPIRSTDETPAIVSSKDMFIIFQTAPVPVAMAPPMPNSAHTVLERMTHAS